MGAPPTATWRRYAGVEYLASGTLTVNVAGDCVLNLPTNGTCTLP